MVVGLRGLGVWGLGFRVPLTNADLLWFLVVDVLFARVCPRGKERCLAASCRSLHEL